MIPRLEPRRLSDRLPIEYPDYEERLSGHPEFLHFREEASFLHTNGYVILPGAVNLELCDRLATYYTQVLTLAADEMPFVEYFDSGQLEYGVRFDAEAMRRSKGQFKIIDLFATNAQALEACMADPITRFLSLIFDSNILAFQQLGFIYGTEQPIHQDTAYVRLSKPAMLAASWIALEDIEPETGELEFLPGSHKVDLFRFDSRSDAACQQIETDPSRSIWYDYKDQQQHSAFLEALNSLTPCLGKKRFHARKGDALIWISFFAHGGSTISPTHLANRTTRKSLVTHYCPHPSCSPLYFHDVLHLAPTLYKDGCFFSSKLYPPRTLPAAFDGNSYLRANPDVEQEQRFAEDPGLHYIDHGEAEGRRLALNHDQ